MGEAYRLTVSQLCDLWLSDDPPDGESADVVRRWLNRQGIHPEPDPAAAAVAAARDRLEQTYRLTHDQLWRRLVDAYMDGGSWGNRGYEVRIAEAEAKANRVIDAMSEADIHPEPDPAAAAVAAARDSWRRNGELLHGSSDMTAQNRVDWTRFDWYEQWRKWSAPLLPKAQFKAAYQAEVDRLTTPPTPAQDAEAR